MPDKLKSLALFQIFAARAAEMQRLRIKAEAGWCEEKLSPPVGSAMDTIKASRYT